MLADTITGLIGGGVLAPATIAFGVCWLSARLLSDAAASRYPIVLGLSAGFTIGSLLVLGEEGLRPARHWHWLPWLGLAAGITGSLGARAAASIRWLLLLATSMAAAWLLVPTWADLHPPRLVWQLGVTTGLCVLCGCADPLPTRFGGRLVLGLLSFTAFAVAAMIAVCVSVTYASVAGVAASALVGVWGAACLGRRDDAVAVRAAIPAALTLIAGIAFVACIESQRPQYGLLLLPAALMGLWTCELPALRRPSGHTATAVRIASVLIPLLAAAVVAYARVF